jgi:cytochrome c oxidase cbb3-type subunit 4
MDFIKEFQGYAYFGMTVVFAVGLYWYIVYLYKGKERGVDYEKYSDLALNDNLDDEILEDNHADKTSESDSSNKR